MKKAKIVASSPVTIVLFIGTWVLLLISEKNDGSSPSLAIAINIRGCRLRIQKSNIYFRRKKKKDSRNDPMLKNIELKMQSFVGVNGSHLWKKRSRQRGTKSSTRSNSDYVPA